MILEFYTKTRAVIEGKIGLYPEKERNIVTSPKK
jgi:hypothetical protein